MPPGCGWVDRLEGKTTTEVNLSIHLTTKLSEISRVGYLSRRYPLILPFFFSVSCRRDAFTLQHIRIISALLYLVCFFVGFRYIHAGGDEEYKWKCRNCANQIYYSCRTPRTTYWALSTTCWFQPLAHYRLRLSLSISKSRIHSSPLHDL